MRHETILSSFLRHSPGSVRGRRTRLYVWAWCRVMTRLGGGMAGWTHRCTPRASEDVDVAAVTPVAGRPERHGKRVGSNARGTNKQLEPAGTARGGPTYLLERVLAGAEASKQQPPGQCGQLPPPNVPMARSQRGVRSQGAFEGRAAGPAPQKCIPSRGRGWAVVPQRAFLPRPHQSGS